MTAPDVLRRAAKLMRERAALVPPSPWFPAVHDVTTHDGLDVIASSGLTVRAQYVASWHPLVALKTAELLESEARRWDAQHPVLVQLIADFDPVVAVARAYLGEASDG